MLSSVSWIQPLLTRLQASGGLQSGNQPLLFEVRVAYAIHLAGHTAEYEHPAGVGTSTIDFRVLGAPEWFIETASIRESAAIKAATVQSGPISEVLLSSFPPNSPQSEEGELLLLEQKIGEKVFRDGAPTKFPAPTTAMHMILVDTRGFNIGIADKYDYDHATQGISVLPSDVYYRYWNNEPIKGLYESCNPLRAAQAIQERIHFIGFIRERDYLDGELGRRIYAAPNPHLLMNYEAAKAAYQTFPLRSQASGPP